MSFTFLRPASSAAGKYRNRFADTGHSTEEVRAKLDRACAQLFHGKSGNEALYFAAGGPAA